MGNIIDEKLLKLLKSVREELAHQQDMWDKNAENYMCKEEKLQHANQCYALRQKVVELIKDMETGYV